jgi:hypothetical protein
MIVLVLKNLLGEGVTCLCNLPKHDPREHAQDLAVNKFCKPHLHRSCRLS